MTLSVRRIGRCLQDDRGSAAIETALSLSVGFSLAFWLLEMSMLVYTLTVLADAAHEGVRYAITHGSDSSNCSGPSSGCTDTSGTNVSNVVKGVAAYSLHNISGMTVSVGYPSSTSTPGSLVTVTISYPYVPFVKLPGLSQTATASAQGRIVF